MLAFVSIAPEDHWEHMSAEIAPLIRMIENSGLAYELGPMGTTIEGEPDAVFELLKRMHLDMRGRSRRVSTFIKIDDQVDRPMGRMRAKVEAVRDKLRG
ncbi:MAG: thiamine-binding protein [bacterium]